MIEKFRELISNIKDAFDDLGTRALLTYNITEEEYEQGIKDMSLKNGAYEFPSINFTSENLNGPGDYPLLPYVGYVERDGVVWVGNGYAQAYVSTTDTTRFIYRISENVITNKSVVDNIPIRPGNTVSGIQACAGSLQTRVAMDANKYIYMINLSTSLTKLSLTVIDPDDNVSNLVPIETIVNSNQYYFLGNTDAIIQYRGFYVPYSEYHSNITDDGGVWLTSYIRHQFYLKDGVVQQTVDMTSLPAWNANMVYQALHTVIGNRLYIYSSDGFIKWCDIDGTQGSIDIRSHFISSSLYANTNKRLFPSPTNNSLYLYTQVNTSTSSADWKGIIKINLNDGSSSFIPGYALPGLTGNFGIGPGVINNNEYLILNNTYDRNSNSLGMSSTGYVTIFNKNDDSINFLSFQQGYTNNYNNYLYQTNDNRILAILKSATSGGGAIYNYSLYELDPVNKSLNSLYEDFGLYNTMPSITDIDNEIYIAERSYLPGSNTLSSLIYTKDNTFYKCTPPPIPAIYPMITKYKNQFIMMDSYAPSLSYSPVTESSFYILNEDNTVMAMSLEEDLVIGSWFYHRNSFSLPIGVMTGASMPVGSTYDSGLYRNKALYDVPTIAGSIVVNGREVVRKQ